MVAMCSREHASSLCSCDLGECSGGVPGGVGVAVALSLPAAAYTRGPVSTSLANTTIRHVSRHAFPYIARLHACDDVWGIEAKQPQGVPAGGATTAVTWRGAGEHRRHGAAVAEELLQHSGEVVPGVQADQGLGRPALLRSLLPESSDGVLVHLCLAHLVAASRDTAHAHGLQVLSPPFSL